jgi:hypothetical protein
MRLFVRIALLAFALMPTVAVAQGQTKRIGNWLAMVPPGKPSVVAVLPSTDKRGMFAIQCFEDEQRVAVQFVVPSVSFDKRSRFKLDLLSPDGERHSIALLGADDEHMVFAFFDRDKAGVFRVVQFFTIFEKVTATITPDFPDRPVTLDFETTGAPDATRLPLQKCAPR